MTEFTILRLSAPIADWTGTSIIIRSPDCPGGIAAIIGGAEEHAPLLAAAAFMYETLRTIAQFAPGNGDVCEIIARRARAAIAKAESTE